MSVQESLTFLFNAIALSFIAIASLDFSRRVISLYNQVFTTPKQLPFTNSQPQLPEEWLLPQEAVATVSVAAKQAVQYQAKALLMLAEAKAVGEVRQSSSVGEAQSPLIEEPLASSESLEALLLGVDLNTLKLRQARKIAKVLGIAQKINGKDQKISGLRTQIQASLQQRQSLQPEVIAAVREKPVAC